MKIHRVSLGQFRSEITKLSEWVNNGTCKVLVESKGNILFVVCGPDVLSTEEIDEVFRQQLQKSPAIWREKYKRLHERYGEGKSPDYSGSNPYEFGSEEFDQWDQGYNEMRKKQIASDS
jgi:hypothetical protein